MSVGYGVTDTHFLFIMDIYRKKKKISMKKFLRVFRTEEEYLEYTASTEFNLNSVSRCREGSLVFYDPADCGSQGIHRTISGETYCNGYDKYVYLYKQVSYDDGVTWETTATTSSLIEKDSEDCGYVPPTPPSDWDITAKFNVTDTSNSTKIANQTTGFSKIEIDGVEQPSVTTGYAFSTTGEHIVKYYLTDTSIGASAFTSCSGMISIEIPDSVTSIGYAAFQGCSSLTRLNSDVDGVFNLPSGVTSIGGQAFAYCSGLTSIDIPDGVTLIGNGVFWNCTRLTSITIEATTPPTLSSAELETTNEGYTFPTRMMRIYVPDESVDLYKNAERWFRYKDRIYPISQLNS